jgi:peptidoglycan/xylan/chitin deacetylase (PgdA/CDA1 family)
MVIRGGRSATLAVKLACEPRPTALNRSLRGAVALLMPLARRPPMDTPDLDTTGAFQGDGWLTPLRARLDRAQAPVEFFFRDDDAGWEDRRLAMLLDVFERHGLPLDVAIIPRELTPRLAEALAVRREPWNGRLGLHQHGLAHVNHEPSGRKCEFGAARERAAQRDDIARGRELLAARLPGMTQPVFTPPWNRCTRTTAEVLRELGFRILSRHASEAAFGIAALDEVPASVDWSYAKRGGSRLSLTELGDLAAAEAGRGGPVGVSLHHAVMDEGELSLLDELCELLAGHAAASCRPLMAFARA